EKVMLTGMSLADAAANLAVAASRPPGSCVVTLGIHPNHAPEPDAEPDGGEDAHFARLARTVRDALSGTSTAPLLAAYGELGL
ncbi:hypothetical protein, partial [Salmonella enterica]|uniref:hypothetical protein n=1 Tax=Salmonella enterica TaxID=28901 RepID=UPI0020C569CC